MFVQPDDRADDGFRSLKERAEGCGELNKEISKKKKADRDLCAQIACKEWIDVRSFGQVFAFKERMYPLECGAGIHSSGGEPVSSGYYQYADYEKREQRSGKREQGIRHNGNKTSDQVCCIQSDGSVNVQLAEKTGFSQEGRRGFERIFKTMLRMMLHQQDRMEVWSCRMYWWQHDEKTPAVSSGKIQRSFKINQVDRPSSLRITVLHGNLKDV